MNGFQRCGVVFLMGNTRYTSSYNSCCIHTLWGYR